MVEKGITQKGPAMKPYIHQGDLLMWNLEASVGKGGANNVPSDVCYLQWYYVLAAAWSETPPDRKALYGQVRITGTCTGRSDDPLVKAITSHQQGMNHPVVDGRASVVPGAAGNIRLGGSAFFVLRLGARFATMYPHTWPRLDLIPGCPPAVAKAIQATIPRLPSA
jgi:hypothetical protein